MGIQLTKYHQELLDFTVITDYTSFSFLLKSEFMSFSSILYKSVAKTYKQTAKAKNIVEFIWQTFYLVSVRLSSIRD